MLANPICTRAQTLLLVRLRAQVAAQSRTGELLLADASCPGGSGGSLQLPAAPGQLSCSFSLSGMPPMDGAVTALVFASSSATAGVAVPLPSEPVRYSLPAGDAATQGGDCLQLGGSSRFAKVQDAGAVVPGMPTREGSGFEAAAALCASTTRTVKLTFGPFRADQCGEYAYESGWQLQQGGAQAVAVRGGGDVLRLPVSVTGCSE